MYMHKTPLDPDEQEILMSFLLPACCILPPSFLAAHTQPRQSPRVVLSVTDGRHNSVGRSLELATVRL